MRKPPDPLRLVPRDAEGRVLAGLVRKFPIEDIPAAIAADGGLGG
jgi:hypothetical protein